MNIKEQIKEAIKNNCFDWNKAVENILKIFEQAGYVQLQADSEGLVEIINPCGICEYNYPQEKKETCVMYQWRNRNE